MKNTVRILLYTVLLALTPSLASAQENYQYLYKVGLVDSLYSEVLNESREIYVQFPESYNPDSPQKYPVTYILDGEVFLPTVSDVHRYYSGGFMPEMILIGISNRTNRTRDLTTSKLSSNAGMPFLKFIQEELIPYIEGRYPVTNFRTLIGHSYGGLFTIYTLLNQPELFANYLAIDPSLDWDHQNLLEQAKKIIPKQKYQGKFLFISLSGQLHMQNPRITIDNVMEDSSEFTLFARSNIMFSNLIEANEQNGLNFKWKFYPGDLHGTVSLPSIMDGLLSFFEWFQMEDTDKINNPETSKEELYRLVKYRANKLKMHFGYKVSPHPEELLNVLGYMSMDRDQFDKAKMFFEFAMEYYPRSANACDSMADYYIAIQDNASALKFATRAYELSGSDDHKNKMNELK